MNDATHTPGPWRLVEVANGVNVEPDVAKIYIQSNRYDGSQSLTRLANAHLIAAAPDLLATLKELIDLEGPLPGNVAWFNKAVAAVARAEGRS